MVKTGKEKLSLHDGKIGAVVKIVKREHAIIPNIINGTIMLDNKDNPFMDIIFRITAKIITMPNLTKIFNVGKYVLISATNPENIALESIKNVKNINIFK